MLVTFKSAASADLLYFGDVASLMMELMGKDATEKGVITVEELPDAIVRLETAVRRIMESFPAKKPVSSQD